MIWLEERRNLSTEVREHIGGATRTTSGCGWTRCGVSGPSWTRPRRTSSRSSPFGMMTSVTFLHLDPYRPDQVATGGFQRLLVTVARRVLLETPAEELTPAVHPSR